MHHGNTIVLRFPAIKNGLEVILIKLRKIAGFEKLPRLIEISAYQTKIPMQLIHDLSKFLLS